MKQDIYFAADEAKETVRMLQDKADEWFKGVTEINYIDKIKRSWSAYHGDYYSDYGQNGHEISFGGENGELVNLAVNHYRNLARHIHNMVTGTRPSFQCRAINTDKKSLIQAKLGNGLLDYYMREMRLEQLLKDAVEYAIVLGSGYIKLEWNSTKGKIYDYVEPDPSSIISYDEDDNPLDAEGNIIKAYPIYEGDVEFNLLSPFDVVFDPTKDYFDKNEWIVCRTFVNKFDLAAKYPELREEILALNTRDEEARSSRRYTTYKYNETVDVAVYEFFHKRTESMENGRYMLYCSEDVVLEDTIMPYRSLPVYRIVPSSILGTPYGYSDMFDLLPLQQMLNSLYSTAATNINAFGVQSILSPRGCDVEAEQVGDGMQFIEYNAQAGKPEPLQLTATSQEVYNMMQLLEKTMETLSGVNSVARGNPEQSLRSGNALALVQSQALQFVSSLQQSYVRLLEDVGTGLINLLKDFASVPRIATISGINNKSEMKEFKADDIKDINRVVVDSGNAMMNCLAKGTEVLMYDGSIRKVEEIRVGDLVMGPDSKPRTVEKTGKGFEEMFEVRTKSKKDQHIYTCNKSHIMTLKYCSDYKDHKKGDVIDIRVHDYLELSDKEKGLLMGFRTGVEFDKKETPIDPYILGSWIGDGNKNEPSITTCDHEVRDAWEDYSKEIGVQFRVRSDYENSAATTYMITSGKQSGSPRRNPMMNGLRDLELIKNKHVPYVYKYSSREDRLSILAGFIDADGTLVDETFVIHQVDDRITDDFEFIARSLGFKVNRYKKKRNAEKMYGKADEIEYNVLSIGGDTWNIPTKIERKKVKEVKKQKDWRNYGINLVSVGHDEYYGFTLKEEPHFLLKDFTVTHNTTAGRAQVAENLLQMGLIDNVDKYLMVMNTGNLDYLTDGKIDNLTLIKGENEALVRGEVLQAIWSEKHSMHIKEHMEVLNDPELKRDPDLVQRVLDHVQEHVNLLRTTDPSILAMIGEQPIAPAPNPANMGQQGQQPQQPANLDPMAQNQAVPMDGSNAAAMSPNTQMPNLPSQPRPAGEGEILPPNMPTSPEDL